MYFVEKLGFKLVHVNAKPPIKTSSLAAGFDLHAVNNEIIMPWSLSVIPTGVIVQLPDNCYGRIAPRSGLALRKYIHVMAGVIDRDFTSEIKCLLFNLGDQPVEINIGDRVAQLICEKISYPELVEIEGNIEKTDRDPRGFGTSGF